MKNGWLGRSNMEMIAAGRDGQTGQSCAIDSTSRFMDVQLPGSASLVRTYHKDFNPCCPNFHTKDDCDLGLISLCGPSALWTSSFLAQPVYKAVPRKKLPVIEQFIKTQKAFTGELLTKEPEVNSNRNPHQVLNGHFEINEAIYSWNKRARYDLDFLEPFTVTVHQTGLQNSARCVPSLITGEISFVGHRGTLALSGSNKIINNRILAFLNQIFGTSRKSCASSPIPIPLPRLGQESEAKSTLPRPTPIPLPRLGQESEAKSTLPRPTPIPLPRLGQESEAKSTLPRPTQRQGLQTMTQYGVGVSTCDLQHLQVSRFYPH
ncbi:hypothetical protein RRG08_067396 [Elysia crispata]|uniref:Uncharacterized protein n=1 Tax=Elysia crispata TaxID=231223 RepID=A0AAE0Y914_9GAST|nr:hypothetical protein RRG08_067396 [Elysia crispata]